MTSKAGRAAYAIKSGTVAAGMTVGNTLAYVAPQLAGAIDIVVVKQPDGSLKSSPFYVRFGKYTGLRSDPTKVSISVNERDAEFCMHMGRTGEAYFIVDVDPGETEPYAEALNGLASPTSGYSTDQEQLASTAEQTSTSLKTALEDTRLRNAASTSALGSIAQEDPSRHMALGACRLSELEGGHALRSDLDSTLSAPASLASPRLPPASPDSEDPLAWSAGHDRRPSHATNSLDKVRGWKMELPADQRSLRDGEEMSGGAAEPAGKIESPPRESPQSHKSLPTSPSPTGKDFTFSPRSSGSSLNIDDSMFSPLRGQPPAAKEGSSPRASLPDSAHLQPGQVRGGPGAGRAKPSSRLRTLAEGDSASGGSDDHSKHSGHMRPPQHPWSVGNPRLLPSPLAAQPQVAVMSSADAAAPVQSSPAGAARDGHSAIIPRRSIDEGDSRRVGNRIELEALDQKVRRGEEPAPFAMAEANQEVRNWQRGGPSPRISPLHKKLAQKIESAAAVSEADSPHLSTAADQNEDCGSSSSSGVGSSEGSSPRVELSKPERLSAGGAHPQLQNQSSVPQCLQPAREADLKAGAGSGAAGTLCAPASAFAASATQHGETRGASFSEDATAQEAEHRLRQASEGTAHLNAAAKLSTQEPSVRDDAFGSSIDLTAWHSSARRSSFEALEAFPPLPTAHEGAQQERRAAQISGEGRSVGGEGGHGVEDDSSDCRGEDALLLQNEAGVIPGPVRTQSPPLLPKSSGRSSLASTSTMAGSVSLPIGIPNSRGQERSNARLPNLDDINAADRPLGGSLPAGAFGMSPTESARYLGNTSGGNEDASLPLAAYRGATNTDWQPSSDPQPASKEGEAAEVEVSLCGSQLHPEISPGEAWRAFEAGRVTRERFQEQGAALLSNPELICRIGDRLLPYQQAAPAVLGMAAFGGRWNALLPDEIGLRVPSQTRDSQELRKDGGKRSSWRVWLGSWRARRDSKTDLAAAAAAAVQKADAETKQADREAPAQASGGELSASLDGMMEAGKRQPGKRRAFTPSSQQLQTLQLLEGQNTIEFVYGKQRLRAYLYYFQWNVRLVISDVDGTITRSDLLGHVLPRVGFDWSHPGINRFFSNIEKNGYHILFLSSRAIAQASATRDYLHSLNQDGHKLPSGPVIISPDGLFPSLYRELVLRRPHEFKIRALEDIRALFPQTWNPFFCGFGNRDTDEISYLTVGVPASKIFIINPKGELRKASSAVVTSTWNSLTRIVDIVNEIFPPYETGAAAAALRSATPEREEFSDYNFWHVAPPIIVDSDDEAFGFGESEEEESEEEADDEIDGSTAEPAPVGFRAWP